MMSDHDVLTRLVEYHDHIAAPPVAVEDDVRRGRRRARRSRALRTGAAVTAVVALVVGGVLVMGRPSDGPVLPAETPRVTTSTPTATDTSAQALLPMAPLRAATSESALMEVDPEGATWRDGRDADFGAVDIDSFVVRTHDYAEPKGSWSFGLRESFPTDPAPGRVVEYGVVLDLDADGAADCQVGLTDAVGPTAKGHYRSWVTDLRSGRTEEESGPGYGRLVDFHHPLEGPPDDADRKRASIFFLSREMGPCGPYSPTSRLYAWAAVGTAGNAAEVDYVPDTGWLALPQ